MLLRVTDATVRFGTLEALRRVTIHAGEGAITAVLGANGAGKTTLLRAISGVYSLEEGEIWFGGKRIDGLSQAEIVGMGIAQVPEGRQLFPRMTVLENLLMGAYLRKDGAAVKQDLDRVSSYFPVLAEFRNRVAGDLSGGQQQMVAIGRALMSRAKLLLLDEPCLGLAPLVVDEIFEIVRTIAAGGTGIILVEQNAVEALKVAQQAYLLEAGSILLQGLAAELANHPEVRRAYLGI